MKFREIYVQEHPVFSVELFPPKTERGWQNLQNRLPELQKYNLDFVSVTYGAGGSNRGKTLALVKAVVEQVGAISVPHFTSIGATRESVKAFLDAAIAQGVENIVALRGDRPKDDPELESLPTEFNYGNELVAFIRSHTDRLDIAVGGYPEKHLEATDMDTDIRYLKQKVNSGADVVITQLFYNNEAFYRFRDLVDRAGITVPIVPGIMPIVKFSQIERITSMCGATIPKSLRENLSAYKDGSPEQRAVGVEYAINQIRELLANDVPGIHIYALNNTKTVDLLMAGMKDFVRERDY